MDTLLRQYIMKNELAEGNKLHSCSNNVVLNDHGHFPYPNDVFSYMNSHSAFHQPAIYCEGHRGNAIVRSRWCHSMITTAPWTTQSNCLCYIRGCGVVCLLIANCIIILQWKKLVWNYYHINISNIMNSIVLLCPLI